MKLKNVIRPTILATSLAPLFVQKVSAASSIRITNFIDTPNFTELVTNVLQWLLGIAGSVALIMIIAGGFFYIGAAGDEQKATQGKKILTWAIGGLVVVLLSYSIIVVIEDIFVN